MQAGKAEEQPPTHMLGAVYLLYPGVTNTSHPLWTTPKPCMRITQEPFPQRHPACYDSTELIIQLFMSPVPQGLRAYTL
jgi:hypothetical protein